MGFWEFIVIAVVGTIVLGPDKLPLAIRKITQTKRQFTQVIQGLTADVNEQLRVHELHENLKKAEELGMENLPPEIQQSVDELTNAAKSVQQNITDSSTDSAKHDK